MEELSRLLLIRPAEAVPPESVDEGTVIELDSGSDLQEELRKAKTPEERAIAAEKFGRTAAFVKYPSSVPHAAGLKAVSRKYKSAPFAASHPMAELQIAVAAVFQNAGAAPKSLDVDDADAVAEWLGGLVQKPQWEATITRLKDSIVAVQEAPRLQRNDLSALADFLRSMALLALLAEESVDALAPSAVLNATLLAPSRQPKPMPEVLPDAEERPQADDSWRKESELVAGALFFLSTIPIDSIPLRSIEAKSVKTLRGKARLKATGRRQAGGLLETQGELNERRLLTAGVLAKAPEAVREYIRKQKFDLRDTALEDAVKVLAAKQKNLGGTQERASSARMVNGVMIAAPISMKNVKIPAPGPMDPGAQPDCAVAVGVGELLVIRQQLKRYEGGDLAHVENILQGETRQREHRRKHTTEDFMLSALETEKSEERETQTTSRFELSAEVKESMKENLKVGAGAEVTASYGPTVSIKANANFSYENAKEESRAQATKMLRETVEKAASKYTEKVREEITRKVIEEVEEKTSHGFNAVGASRHIVGVYQWLNKIYEAQVYNYGLRAMFEFMVPEPAAYYIWALGKKADAEAPDLAPPPAFSLTPSGVTEGNYAFFTALYEADGVKPAPEIYATVEIHKSGSGQDGIVSDSDAAQLPDGYEYYSKSTSRAFTHKEDKNAELVVNASAAYDDPGKVPMYLVGHDILSYGVYVHIRCRRTAAKFEDWRNDVWDALYKGHLKQVATYQERLANLVRPDSGLQISGRNPLINRQIEKEELKKHCLTLLIDFPPIWFNGIIETPVGPFPSCAASIGQGAFVRFMEQAFEWENMTYVLYPYFWARIAKWQELFGVQDVDPQFERFLKAGYARVQVPVRPGFETAVDHYRKTGQIWSGGDLPTVTDPLYLPIVEELKAQLQAPGSEEPVGDPWDVLVPTQLNKLRAANDLPSWSKQPDGSWTEDNPG